MGFFIEHQRNVIDYEKVKKELEELKKQNAAKCCLHEDWKEENVRTCPICCQQPEVPVVECYRNGKFESCSASRKSGCLRCIRDYTSCGKNNQTKKCFAVVMK